MRRISLTVIPRSSHNEIVGTCADGTLKIRITAAPVDGAANDAVIDLLSDTWHVRKSSINIIKGLTSKHKIVEVDI